MYLTRVWLVDASADLYTTQSLPSVDRPMVNSSELSMPEAQGGMCQEEDGELVGCQVVSKLVLDDVKTLVVCRYCGRDIVRYLPWMTVVMAALRPAGVRNWLDHSTPPPLVAVAAPPGSQRYSFSSPPPS